MMIKILLFFIIVLILTLILPLINLYLIKKDFLEKN